jgi:hypothetical protein
MPSQSAQALLEMPRAQQKWREFRLATWMGPIGNDEWVPRHGIGNLEFSHIPFRNKGPRSVGERRASRDNQAVSSCRD